MKGRNHKKFLLAAGATIAVFLTIGIVASLSHRTLPRTPVHEAASGGEIPYQGIGANSEAKLRHDFEAQVKALQKQQQQQYEHLRQWLQQAENNTRQAPQPRHDLNDYKNRLQQLIARSEQKIEAMAHKQQNLPVGKGEITNTPAESGNAVVWIRDMANTYETKALNRHSGADPLGDIHYDLFGQGSAPAASSSASGKADRSARAKGIQSDSRAAFTIPNPSVLTDVLSMTPLVGRVPMGDEHKVIAPYQVLFVTEHPNITSNSHHLAMDLRKMMGTATCVGDFMASANSCTVTTLTLVFHDGTISTVNADNKGHQKDAQQQTGLGYLTDAYGNPQITGELKSSLGVRLAMMAGTAGVSALGAGVSQGGLSLAGSEIGGDTGLLSANRVTNISKYAGGQAINAASQGVNKAWEQVSRNMFDYVYTPNWDAQNGSLKRLNVVITRELDYNYDPQGRKLDHGMPTHNTAAHLLL